MIRPHRGCCSHRDSKRPPLASGSEHVESVLLRRGTHLVTIVKLLSGNVMGRVFTSPAECRILDLSPMRPRAAKAARESARTQRCDCAAFALALTMIEISVRRRISLETWEQVKTAYAAGDRFVGDRTQYEPLAGNCSLASKTSRLDPTNSGCEGHHSL